MWWIIGIVAWLVISFLVALVVGPMLAEVSKNYPEVRPNDIQRR